MAPRRRAFWLLLSAPAACLTALAITAGGTPPAGAAGEATKTITVVVADDASDPNPTASTWGHVTSDPPGIDCPDACSAAFPQGSAIQLTVQHDDGDYAFVGWSVFGNDAGPDCDIAETCSLTLAQDTQDVTVEARLKPATQLWAIPEGAGTLSIDPPEQGRDPAQCSVDNPVFAPLPTPCSPRYPTGTQVTVTANANPDVDGAHFVRWSDFRCPREPSCTVTMRGDLNLSAFFSPVSLTVVGGSFGSVTVTPPGTTCALPSDPLETSDPPCQFTYPLDSTVTIERDPSAAQNPGDEWTGACTGSDQTCTLKLRKNELVRAGTDPTFDIPTPLGPPLKLLYKGRKGGSIRVTSTSGPQRTFVCRSAKGCTSTAFSRYQHVEVVAKGSRRARARFRRWADTRFPFSSRPLIIGNRSAVKAVFVRR